MTPQTNPILEEVWRIKDDIAREAEYEPRRLCENTRRWVAENMPEGMKAFTFEEWRSFLTKKADAEIISSFDVNEPDTREAVLKITSNNEIQGLYKP